VVATAVATRTTADDPFRAAGSTAAAAVSFRAQDRILQP